MLDGLMKKAEDNSHKFLVDRGLIIEKKIENKKTTANKRQKKAA